MATTAQPVAEVCAQAKRAARELALLDTATKNAALEAMAQALEQRMHEILEANARDMEAGREAGLHSGLLDRLKLDEGRLAGIARDVRAIARCPTPWARRSRATGSTTGSTSGACACRSAWWRWCTRRGRT